MTELPFPAKILWPNGRGHHMAKHREFQKHKGWAQIAFAGRSVFGLASGSRLRILAQFHPKTRHTIDKDNASASLKAYQDGIALALKIDDSRFDEPKITFGEPAKNGLVYITLEAI